jgi:hypothetical protein
VDYFVRSCGVEVSRIQGRKAAQTKRGQGACGLELGVVGTFSCFDVVVSEFGASISEQGLCATVLPQVWQNVESLFCVNDDTLTIVTG